MARNLPAPLTVLLLLLSACGTGTPGQPEVPTSTAPGPLGDIQVLLAVVEALSPDRDAESDPYEKLRWSLEDARLALVQARPEDAVQAMEQFQDLLVSLGDQDLLEDVDIDGLSMRSHAATEEIAALAEPTPPESACAGELPVFFVDAAAPDDGDGSAALPFAAIQDALDEAEAANLAGVEIRVAFGVYPEHLEITRNTRIVGEWTLLLAPLLVGSIQNTGPYCLEVECLEITDAGSGPAGGIYVSHPSARTTLRRVVIREARAFGLVQRGGTLLVEG